MVRAPDGGSAIGSLVPTPCDAVPRHSFCLKKEASPAFTRLCVFSCDAHQSHGKAQLYLEEAPPPQFHCFLAVSRAFLMHLLVFVPAVLLPGTCFSLCLPFGFKSFNKSNDVSCMKARPCLPKILPMQINPASSAPSQAALSCHGAGDL